LSTFYKILYYTITVCIGALFLFSAYSKIIGIQNFEWTLAETNIMSFGMANIISRIILIAEAIIGFFFLFNFHFNKKLYKYAVWLLVIFNIYLLWVMYAYGLSGNCGCFGQVIEMTPMQASLKNMGIIALIFVLSIFNIQWLVWPKWVIIGISCIGILSIIPPDFIFISEKDVVVNQTISLNEMYTNTASTKPKFDYKKGKYIISILSTTCHHCKSAARKMAIMQKRNNSLPFYNIYSGDSTSLQEFFTEANAQNIPYQINSDYGFINRLLSLQGQKGYPKILWVQDGKLIKISNNYFTLNQNAIEQWQQTK
jgi:thiol-disulfide isomerase/thioredoxin